MKLKSTRRSALRLAVVAFPATQNNIFLISYFDGGTNVPATATEVGPNSNMAVTISGKVYRFPPSEINVKSLWLILTDPQPRYDIETYVRDKTKSGPNLPARSGWADSTERGS